MLATSDQAVLKRDPQLPGLALLLDTKRMLDVLQLIYPQQHIQGLTSTYLKYKPQTNCLVGFLADTSSGPMRITAKTLPEREYAKARAKAEKEDAAAQAHGQHHFLDEWLTMLWAFPMDKKIAGLVDLAHADRRMVLLQSLLPDQPELWPAELETLCYKPERRFVGRLNLAGKARALIKIYEDDFKNAWKAAQTIDAFPADARLTVSRPLGQSREKRIIISQWLPGTALRRQLFSADAALDQQQLQAIGTALAVFHQQEPGMLAKISREHEALAVLAAAGAAAFLQPALSQRLRSLAAELAAELLVVPAQLCPIHGDFSADQVLVNGKAIAIIDYDQARLGDPAADFGAFTAQLIYDEITGRLKSGSAEAISAHLLQGYCSEGGGKQRPARTDLYLAVKVLQLAPQLFRERQPNWADRMELVLQHAEKNWKAYAKTLPSSVSSAASFAG